MSCLSLIKYWPKISITISLQLNENCGMPESDMGIMKNLGATVMNPGKKVSWYDTRPGQYLSGIFKFWVEEALYDFR